MNLTPAQAENFLTPREREILATEHLTFRVNVPVRVTVLRDTRLGSNPFGCASAVSSPRTSRSSTAGSL